MFNLAAANCQKTRLVRIRKLMGKHFIDESNYLEIEHAGLSLCGWVSTKEYQRSQNDKQWIYVNSRMVKDKLLSHAVKRAYESVLYPGRHPSCLLYLTLNPEEVDVNVHPTKHEVRFLQPRLVHDFISSQIQQALHLTQPNQEYPIESKVEARVEQICEPYSPPILRPIKRMDASRGDVRKWLVLNSSFVLLFLQDKPYLIDVVSIQRQWLKASLIAEPLPLARRPLLVPISYSIKQVKIEDFNSYKQNLNQLGIDADLAGEDTIILRSLPTAIPYLDIKQFLAASLKSALPTIPFLFELLVSCQTFEAQQARQEETEALICYIESLDNEQLTPWAKHLSLASCLEWLNA